MKSCEEARVVELGMYNYLVFLFTCGMFWFVVEKVVCISVSACVSHTQMSERSGSKYSKSSIR